MILTGKSTGIVCVDPLRKLAITSDGGLAISMVNKTGGTSVKGYCAHASSGTDYGFDFTPLDEPDIIGIVFGDDDGNQVGDVSSCWIVTNGQAYVYTINAVSREDFVRMGVTADGGAAGQCYAESAPSSPFSTDKHFMEVGHALAATGGAGLVLCSIHFN